MVIDGLSLDDSNLRHLLDGFSKSSILFDSFPSSVYHVYPYSFDSTWRPRGVLTGRPSFEVVMFYGSVSSLAFASERFVRFVRRVFGQLGRANSAVRSLEAEHAGCRYAYRARASIEA